MLAARVAQERGVQLGQEVGYQIRLDNVSNSRTRIRFVTEGVLLRQMGNRRFEPLRIELETRLVTRDSTGAPR